MSGFLIIVIFYSKDLSSNPHKFREDLFNIARTTLSSKVLSQDKDYFANLAVDAVLRLKVLSCLTLPLEQRQTEVFGTGINRSGTHPNHQKSWREANRLLSRRGLHPGQNYRSELTEADGECQDSYCKHLCVR